MSEADPATDTLDPFARRASLLFFAFILLDVIVGVVSLASDRPVAERVLALVGPVAWSVLAVVLISGLGRRTWATSASIVVLWGLIVAGAIETVVAFGEGRVHFPIGLLLAVVVLRSVPTGVRVWSGDRAARLGATIAGVVVAFVIAWPLALGALLKPGASPLSVGPDALDLDLQVECSAPLAAGESVPATVHIAWQLPNEWLTDGTDGVVAEWSAVTGSSEPPSFRLDGYESSAVDAEIWEADRNAGSVSFGFDVRSGNRIDGVLDLALQGDSQPRGQLIVQARYSHLDRWTTRSEDVSCSW